MDQCTAVTLLPPPDFVLRLAAVGGGSRPEAGHLLCELAADHDGDHAMALWDDDTNHTAVWARWRGEWATLAELAWCGVVDPRGEDACGLFAGHPSVHDWAIVDPTLAAVDALLAGAHPHLFSERDR
ncbi:hypothetical protein YW5DRAFT_02424 [Streptomyces sp. Ncost-T6T-1]|uniref:hypothetical protein n=1 Tax=Streptomyces sp. Ncost-T6T-1 TaxID=1100828 RepID=UPI000804DFF7|nr:hypothetical protein [Streptomyces sp. Ncost-T6T-1]SBV04093.1 hypothetical protein YW5DRAFT_02424 [Streptomyces sp. Ncost-T6T-1]